MPVTLFWPEIDKAAEPARWEMDLNIKLGIRTATWHVRQNTQYDTRDGDIAILGISEIRWLESGTYLHISICLPLI